jgi:Acetyltransferases
MPEKNKSELYFRALEKKDVARIQAIICETWRFDEYSADAKTVSRISACYLYSCLLRHAFNLVATHNGETIGLVVCTDRRKNPRARFLYLLRMFLAYFPLTLKREGRLAAKEIRAIQDEDKKLRGKLPHPFDAEISLFIVSKKYRGLGIGKMLFQEALGFFYDMNIMSYCAFTDTDCNFGFYDAQGLKKVAERRLSFDGCPAKDFRVFLYGKRSSCLLAE